MRVLFLAGLTLAVATVPACACSGSDYYVASRDANLPVDGGRDAFVAPHDARTVFPHDAPLNDTAIDHTRGPPYPIVFAHGFFGFEDFAGIDYIDYFFHVRQHLEASGETLAYFTVVDPFNTSQVRGAQLAEQVQHILDETGYRQVVLVGHSQGGLDARVVAHDHPEWVAAVYTIATPHGGSEVSNVVDQLVSDARFRDALNALASLVILPLWDGAGETTSVWLGIDQFNAPNTAAFNAAYPDSPQVPYFSIGGRSARHDGGDLCRNAERPPFIARYDGVTDSIDPLLSVTNAILAGDPFHPTANDGLVTVESSMHGTFLGCIPADHLDEIGQLFGDDPGAFNDFDHYEFYRALVDFIRARGD